MNKTYGQRMLAKARPKYGKPMYPGRTGGKHEIPVKNVSENMDIWNQILKEMREQLPRISYETGIEPCRLIKLTQNKLVLAAENDFCLAVLGKRYLVLLQKVAEKILGGELQIEVMVSKQCF